MTSTRCSLGQLYNQWLFVNSATSIFFRHYWNWTTLFFGHKSLGIGILKALKEPFICLVRQCKRNEVIKESVGFVGTLSVGFRGIIFYRFFRWIHPRLRRDLPKPIFRVVLVLFKLKRKYPSPYGGFRCVSRLKMNSIARRRVKLNVKTGGGSLKLAEV